jgi:Uma2 family endonuclease
MTTAAISTARFTPSDVLRLEDEALYELVNGKLVEKSLSSEASKVAGIITGQLFIYCQQSKAGILYPEQSFQCFPHDRQLIRRPDIAFIAADRVSLVEPEGHVTVVPDLAIEVVSPTDKVYELDEKIDDYRTAGIKSIWIVNPKLRRIQLYWVNQPVKELRESDVLSGDPALPGFSLPVRELLNLK